MEEKNPKRLKRSLLTTALPSLRSLRLLEVTGFCNKRTSPSDVC